MAKIKGKRGFRFIKELGGAIRRETVSKCGFDSRRVHYLRRVAGYGLPGRFAKPCGRKAVRVQIPCLPLLLPRW